MKNSLLQVTGRVGKSAVLVALVSLGICSEISAAVSLTHGNSIVTIDPNSQAGVNQWIVDGANALNKEWYWWRVGATGEQSLDAIGAPAITTLNPYSARLVYTMPGLFNVQVTYTLQGGLLGSATSDLSEQVQINNLSGSALDFHLFQYADFNLGGSDSVGLGTNLRGKFFTANQTSGGALQNTVVSPGASHGEVALVPVTLNSLNDGLPTTLSDTAVASGDVSWAFQWDFTIAAGSSAQLGKDGHLVVAVPEPTVALFGGVGLTVLLITARRRRS